MTSRAALAVLLLAFTAAPTAGGPRDDALAGLRNTDDAQARRRGALALADSGTMADLPVLAKALRDPDPAVREVAGDAMWSVWSRSGDEAVDRLFAIGVAQLGERDVAGSVETFTDVIRRKPDFAEGWNKRATAYFMLGELAKSLADCDEVMKRNPYHWGALSGYGMIYLQQDKPARALEYFEKALAVNPNLSSVQETVDALKSLLIQRRRDMI